MRVIPELARSEVGRVLTNDATFFIEQVVPRSTLPSPSINLINMNLSFIAEAFRKSSNIRNISLSSPIIKRQPHGDITIHPEPLFLSSAPIHSTGQFGLDHFLKISEGLQKLWIMDSLEFGGLQTPGRMSRVSSSKKLNGDEIAETLQSEVSFTIATDKKPIVATYGCGPCVAVGGYDRTNKIAFVVHFSNAREVTECGGMIFWNISKLAKEKFENPIQIHLRGGTLGEHSKATIEAIKKWMTWREDMPMEIASEDILDNGMCFDGKSLSIDSRTGSVSEYDPKDNPKSRGMSEFEAMSAMMSALIPDIKLAYSPQ